MQSWNMCVMWSPWRSNILNIVLSLVHFNIRLFLKLKCDIITDLVLYTTCIVKEIPHTHGQKLTWHLMKMYTDYVPRLWRCPRITLTVLISQYLCPNCMYLPLTRWQWLSQAHRDWLCRYVPMLISLLPKICDCTCICVFDTESWTVSVALIQSEETVLLM